MANNFIQKGDVLDHIAEAVIQSGDVVVLNDRIGIALTNIATGEEGAVQVTGVFSLPNGSTAEIKQGEDLYWNGTGIVKTATDNAPAGFAAGNAATGEPVAVKING